MSAPDLRAARIFGHLVDVIKRSNTATPEDRAATMAACESVMRDHFAAVADAERRAGLESVSFRDACGIVLAEVLFRVLHGPRFAFEAAVRRATAIRGDT